MSTHAPPKPHTSTTVVGSSEQMATPWVMDGVLVLRSSTNSRYRTAQKKDRRGSRHSHDGQDDKKPPLRERASWRNIRALAASSSSPPVVAQWRRAKLMLKENLHPHSGSHLSPTLTLRYDDTSDEIILYINHCNSTDIRIVDQSLFEPPNCLGIYNNFLKNNGDHVFIHFPSSDSLRYWFGLLRTFTIAEIYGAGATPESQGGIYRVARSIEIAIQHGRNIGIGLGSTSSATRKAAPLDLANYEAAGFGGGLNPHPLPHLLGGRKRSYDPFQAPIQRDQSEPDSFQGTAVFCEIELGGDVCARSSTRRSSRTSENATTAEPSWTWHTWNEKFFLSDLPPFAAQNTADGDIVDHGTLCINVYRVSKQRQGNSIPFGGGSKKTSYSSPSLTTSPSFSQYFTGASIFNASQHLSASPSVGFFSPDTQSSQGSSGVQPVPIGSIRIPLENFRRNEWVMGYYPVMSSTQSGAPGSNQIGDMMLRLRCQEDVIVPLDRYNKLIQFLATDPFSLISDIVERTSTPLRPESEVRMDTASRLVDISLAGGSLVEDLCQAVQRELVDAKAQIIFRDNTPCIAAVQQAVFKLGQSFLETSLRPPLRRLLSEQRASEENVDDFPRYLEEIWHSIYRNRHKCPEDLRCLFSRIIQQVETRFPNSAQSGSEYLPLQSITSLCFLRFFVPAIMNPGMFGLVHGSLPPFVEIKLKHVSRVIQAMANFKDPSNMYNEDEATREFMSKNQIAMQEYVRVVSTLSSLDNDQARSSSESAATLDHHALVSRIEQLPVLHRESIPSNSSMIDYPRHLASLVSSIVSYARWPRGTRDLPQTSGFLECAAICFVIETETLTAVAMLNHEASEEGEQESSLMVSQFGEAGNTFSTSVRGVHSVDIPASSASAGMVFTPRGPEYDDIFTQSASSSRAFLTSLQGPLGGSRRDPR